MTCFSALVKRDILLGWKNPWEILLVLIFFLASSALFPLSIGSDLNLLSGIAGGIAMTLAMLAALLSMERLFLSDYEDGSLDLLSQSPLSLFSIVLAKSLSHWLTILLPLIFLMPFLGMMMGVKPEHVWIFPFFSALATPALSLLGAFGAALTLGSRRMGLLMIFLILPLFVPFLIFSSLGIDLGQKGDDIETIILLLTALNLLAFATLPWATSFALKDALRAA